jgi:SAM-dependent methyltransferase
MNSSDPAIGFSYTALRRLLKSLPFTRKVVHHFRRQAQLRRAREAWTSYAATHDVRALNIGSSSHVLPGWFNVDYFAVYLNQYFMDAAASFPFPDNSFDIIRSEHMIEHVPYLSGMHMLSECHRVLRPGGYIRISTPDLRKLAQLYNVPLSEEQQAYVDWVFRRWRSDTASVEVGVVINNIFQFDSHYFIYDSGTLGEGMRKAGFVNVVQSEPGHSDHEMLRTTDLHVGDDFIAFETLAMEGQKKPHEGLHRARSQRLLSDDRGEGGSRTRSQGQADEG